MNISSPDTRFFCFGLGYSALVFAKRLMSQGWSVAGTCQSPDKEAKLTALGIETYLFDQDNPLPEKALDGTTHMLISVPPGQDGDPVLKSLKQDITDLNQLEWVGYLSTTGVYGDTGGEVVTEESPLNPSSKRSRNRVHAEQEWQALNLPLHIFRLAGIYGPGSSQVDKVKAGTAKRIDKPGHCFGRIYVEDIATVLQASLAHPSPGALYNVCDNEPAAPAEVTAEACRLLGIEPPPIIPFEVARQDMSPMGLSFWNDNRRVDNSRIISELGVELACPTYREGLAKIIEQDKRDSSMPGARPQ